MKGQLPLDLGMGNRFYDERLHKAHVRARKRWMSDYYLLHRRLYDAHVRTRARWRLDRWRHANGFHNAHVLAWRRWTRLQAWRALSPEKRYAIRVAAQLIRRVSGR